MFTPVYYAYFEKHLPRPISRHEFVTRSINLANCTTSMILIREHHAGTASTKSMRSPARATAEFARAAVAITVHCASSSRFVMVTRSRPPNLHHWSLPGGKIELGETAIEAARRELSEECGLIAGTHVDFAAVPHTTTDVIAPHPEGGGFAHHYLLAQTFAELRPGLDGEALLVAGDDAGAAGWFTLDEMHRLHEQGEVTREVIDVVRRCVELRGAGFLDT